MKRISIKWFNHLNEPPVVLTGLVSIWEGTRTPLGDFKLEVTKSGHSYSPVIDRHLPPICSDENLMHEVSKIAEMYRRGLEREESVHSWL
jgi:hypothetical protein